LLIFDSIFFNAFIMQIYKKSLSVSRMLNPGCIGCIKEGASGKAGLAFEAFRRFDKEIRSFQMI